MPNTLKRSNGSTTKRTKRSSATRNRSIVAKQPVGLHPDEIDLKKIKAEVARKYTKQELQFVVALAVSVTLNVVAAVAWWLGR